MKTYGQIIVDRRSFLLILNVFTGAAIPRRHAVNTARSVHHDPARSQGHRAGSWCIACHGVWGKTRSLVLPHCLRDNGHEWPVGTARAVGWMGFRIVASSSRVHEMLKARTLECIIEYKLLPTGLLMAA